MNLRIFSVIISFLIFLSCTQQPEQTEANTFAPQVVQAKGYVVPKDSISTPKVVTAGKPKVIIAGKPTVVTARVNMHPAGTPKIVIAGTPRVCTPGKDSFTLPKVVPAISRPFVAGTPHMVVAKDANAKEQNPGNFSSFSKLQGLVNDRVSGIKQDKNGNLWVATYGGGVARFDGKNFTNFTVKEGLAENFIFSIYVDKAGNIWIGTRNHGLSKFDGINFTNYTEKEGLGRNNVHSILEDKAGNFWFGGNGGVSKYDGRNFTTYTQKQGLRNDSVRSILEDKSGNLWFCTAGGLSKYDGSNFTNFTEKEGLIKNDVNRIVEDKSGNFWIGTGSSGISKFDGKHFTHFTETEGLSNNRIRSILQDKSGNIWVGTNDGGISKYDGTNFTHFTDAEGLSNNSVTCILEDKSGTLWFGTEGGGVSKYSGNIFTHVTKSEGLSDNSVWALFEDKSGNIWMGTFGGGVVKYNGKSFIQFTKKEGLINNGVWVILEDKSGNIWLGIANGGIQKYDGKTFTNFTKEEGLCNNSVRSMIQDRSGNLWIGTYNGGVSKYDGKTFTNFTTKEGLSDNQVYRIFEDRAGNIWFGTREGGVTKYDGNTFTHFTTKQGLRGNTVVGITEDKSGNLWFATFGGLTRYDGKTFTHFTEKEGLSNNEVWSNLIDSSGNHWAGANFGLNKLTQKTLLNLPANAQGSVSNKVDNRGHEHAGKPLFKSYSYEDGFLGIGCKMAILEDRKGTIWIGADDRVTAYHPRGDIRDTTPPNIQLTGIGLFNENIPWVKDTSILLGNGLRVGHFTFDSLSRWYNIPQHLSLPDNNNYLTFSFIGITTNSPQKVKYQYQLEGLDKNWSALTSRTEAPYGNLPHGNYTFKVKAMNSEGYWSNEFNYSFTIRPPWWQTWWAYCIYSLLFIAAVYAVHRFQRHRLIAAERERTRERELAQAKEIEKAYHQLKTTQAQLIQSEKMASLGELTAGIAHEIQNPLNFVNNFSETNIELIEEMQTEIDKGNIGEVKAIANDVKDNEQKINHHGKRADAIVKGMLQHSRASSGKKEPTDINALADEYLRLSYHGLRAKDKDFNANFITDFDESIGMIEVVPQDIGRVLLNLYNNAFYSVNEKKKQLNGTFEPIVEVSTKRVGDKVIIAVRDNGVGIPQKVLNKIFQPFFTTKPTGQGTGLGLSLSYDIIKAHGGDIKVETIDGQETAFILHLPLINKI